MFRFSTGRDFTVMKARKGSVGELREKLTRLAEEIRTHYADMCKSQKAAVNHAIRTGTRLIQAKQTLRRLKQKLQEEGGKPPLSWPEWLEKNFPGATQRTAELYMQLSRNQEKFRQELESPNVSIRKLIQIMRGLDQDGADPQPTPDEHRADIPEPTGRYPTFDLDRARADLARDFKEGIKNWPDACVLYLSGVNDLPHFLGEVMHDIYPLASLWLRVKRGEVYAEHDHFPGSSTDPDNPEEEVTDAVHHAQKQFGRELYNLVIAERSLGEGSAYQRQVVGKWLNLECYEGLFDRVEKQQLEDWVNGNQVKRKKGGKQRTEPGTNGHGNGNGEVNGNGKSSSH